MRATRTIRRGAAQHSNHHPPNQRCTARAPRVDLRRKDDHARLGLGAGPWGWGTVYLVYGVSVKYPALNQRCMTLLYVEAACFVVDGSRPSASPTPSRVRPPPPRQP